jgi:putative spermidine/putrescine transport system ATP-binding protein
LQQQERALTTIMVTHDQQEAMTMADRLVVMRDGRVQQVGRQEDLYERPATPFVVRFIGNSNLLSGNLADHSQFRGHVGADIYLAGFYAGGGGATIALRPERITLSAPTADARTQGEVLMSAHMGAVVEHVVALDAQTHVVTRGPSFGDHATTRFPVGVALYLMRIWCDLGAKSSGIARSGDRRFCCNVWTLAASHLREGINLPFSRQLRTVPR